MIPHTGRSVYALPADLVGNGQLSLDDRHQFGGNRGALVGVASLNHDAYEWLCARRAEHNASIATKCRLSGRNGGPERFAVVQTLARGAHADQLLGKLLDRERGFAEGLTGTLQGCKHHHSGQWSVTCGLMIERDHVPGLLASEHGTVASHRLEYVAVPHVCDLERATECDQCVMCPEVSHARDDHAVPWQGIASESISRQNRQMRKRVVMRFVMLSWPLLLGLVCRCGA